MLPPYTTNEITEALCRGLTAAGVPVSQLRVIAHSVSRVWVIEARFPAYGAISAHYPFAEPDGILTPAELAARFGSRASREIRRSSRGGPGAA